MTRLFTLYDGIFPREVSFCRSKQRFEGYPMPAYVVQGPVGHCRHPLFLTFLTRIEGERHVCGGIGLELGDTSCLEFAVLWRVNHSGGLETYAAVFCATCGAAAIPAIHWSRRISRSSRCLSEDLSITSGNLPIPDLMCSVCSSARSREEIAKMARGQLATQHK
jgi:hypothetical protein